MFNAKPDHLSMTPGNHMVEKDKWLVQAVFRPSHAVKHAYSALTHTHK